MQQWSEMSPAERTAYAIKSVERHRSASLKYPMSVMAAAVGTNATVLREYADPNYKSFRRAAAREGMKALREERAAEEDLEATKAEYEERRREIPDDNRPPSAVLFGDPIPGDTRRQRYGNDYTAMAGSHYAAPNRVGGWYSDGIFC